MANQILFTPNDNNLGTVSNKVMVGKNFTGDLASFNGKVFVIDLENLPYIPTYGSMNFGGKTYQTVIYPTQEWTTENLDYSDNTIPIKTFSTIDYDNPAAYYINDNQNYAKLHKYGLFYNSRCISHINSLLSNGWHIPTPQEYQILVDFVGENNTYKIKSTSDWNTSNTNEYGLNIVPAGWLDGTESYKFEHEQARFLCDGANEGDTNTFCFFDNNETTPGHMLNNYYSFSIRLVRNLT